jgi:hypothetical protein
LQEVADELGVKLGDSVGVKCGRPIVVSEGKLPKRWVLGKDQISKFNPEVVNDLGEL